MRLAIFLSTMVHALALGGLAAWKLEQWDVRFRINHGKPLEIQAALDQPRTISPPVVQILPPPAPAENREPLTAPSIEPPRESIAKQPWSDSPPPVLRREWGITPPPSPARVARAAEKPDLPSMSAAAPVVAGTRAHVVARPVVEVNISLPDAAQTGLAVDHLPSKLPSNLPPPYPSELEAQSIEGRVVLNVLVSATGSVEQITVAESSGRARFDTVALETVRSWRFSPAKRQGAAVAYEIRVPVNFYLRR